MGTAKADIYEQLKSNLYLDDAVTGEAAGIAMGLVMMGTKSPGAIEDMVTVSPHPLFLSLSLPTLYDHQYDRAPPWPGPWDQLKRWLR